jgi:hypothetical protein
VANYLENTGEDEPDDEDLFDDQGQIYKTFLTSVMILQTICCLSLADILA